MDQQELKNVLEMHRRWVMGDSEGKRADLTGADLRGAYLTGADLTGADLTGADLRGAYLRGANLGGAYLGGAYLRGAYLGGAYLRGAKLDPIKEDFIKRLSLVPDEVAGLYDHLMRGKIDGSAYEGECACFVGTIRNIKGVSFDELETVTKLRKQSDSPTERWFLAIQKGDTPQSNPVADITREWIEEWMKEREQVLPQYKLVSSDEFPAAFELEE